MDKDEGFIAMLQFGRHRKDFPASDIELKDYKKYVCTIEMPKMHLLRNELDYFGATNEFTQLRVKADVLLVKPVFFRYLAKQAKKYNMHIDYYPTKGTILADKYPQGLAYFTVFEDQIKIDMYTYAEDSIADMRRTLKATNKYDYSNDKEVWD